MKSMNPDLFVFAAVFIAFSLLYVYYEASRIKTYTRRKENCQQPRRVRVIDVKTEKEYYKGREPVTYFVHTFADDHVTYYKKHARCLYRLNRGDETTIYVNAMDPEEFFFPEEVEPKKGNMIVVIIMAFVIGLVLGNTIYHIIFRVIL